jgi:hypothetical protein
MMHGDSVLQQLDDAIARYPQQRELLRLIGRMLRWPLSDSAHGIWTYGRGMRILGLAVAFGCCGSLLPHGLSAMRDFFWAAIPRGHHPPSIVQ